MRNPTSIVKMSHRNFSKTRGVISAQIMSAHNQEVKEIRMALNTIISTALFSLDKDLQYVAKLTVNRI